MVVLFRRFSSCSISPKLFTNSMLRNDSVVAPARAVVSPKICREMVLIFLPKNELMLAMMGTVARYKGPSNQWMLMAYTNTNTMPMSD